jgi:hypothetical protein
MANEAAFTPHGERLKEPRSPAVAEPPGGKRIKLGDFQKGEARPSMSVITNRIPDVMDPNNVTTLFEARQLR